MHAGYAACRHHLAGGVIALEPGHQQPGRAVLQQLAQQVFLFIRVVVGHAHQHLVARRAQGALHGLQHIDKQRIGQQGNQHHHLRAVARGQRPGRGVGHIAQFLGRCLHACHQLRVHGTLTAQRAGHGDGAHLRQPRHIGQRDATGGARSGRGFFCR